jgi:hypothetical protein
MQASIRGRVAAAIFLGGCGKQAEQQSQPNPKAVVKPPHCFFKDSETKGWKLAGKGDTLIVTGRAYRSDPRYKTVLLDPVVTGRLAVLRPSIAVNDTGFATIDNWWDLEAKLPRGSIDRVEIRCGKNLVATLPVDGAMRRTE